MSLKQFLAVGKSFADMPEGKSPFEMREELRLPRFENEPRFTTKQPILVQTDWIAGKEHRLADPKGAAKPRKVVQTRQKRSWLRFLTFGLFGRKEKFAGHLVQDEMHLENVRVMRNDLVDADLEVVVNKQKKFALRARKAEVPVQVERKSQPALTAEHPSPCPLPSRGEGKTARPALRPKRYEWSELTARLFELGQH
jgi:hypothetical protein